MTPMIEVDQATDRSIDMAARLTGVSKGAVVARLVAQTLAAPIPESTGGGGGSNSSGPYATTLPVYADYMGHRTQGQFDRATHRIDITSGPLAGSQFKSPSAAAIALVSHHKPGVSPNRNGWSFWYLDDGSKRLLQAIRHDSK